MAAVAEDYRDERRIAVALWRPRGHKSLPFALRGFRASAFERQCKSGIAGRRFTLLQWQK
jgi:hypothetical protein